MSLRSLHLKVWEEHLLNMLRFAPLKAREGTVYTLSRANAKIWGLGFPDLLE